MKAVGSAKFRMTFLDLARDAEPVEVTHLGKVIAEFRPVKSDATRDHATHGGASWASCRLCREEPVEAKVG